MAKDFKKQLALDIEKMEAFDLEIDVKVSKAVEVITALEINGMITEEDSKQVRAHKSNTVRKVNRAIEKFAKELNTILGHDNNEGQGE